MRPVLVVAFCVFVAACAGGPSAPTSPPAASHQGAQVTQATQATSGSELPFRGTLEAHETENGPLRHLVGSGNATQLGRFTVTSDFTVVAPNASGTAAWTAANGDQLFTTFTGQAIVAFPTAVVTETDTITGGTGRFAGASGTFVVERSLNLQTGNSTGSMTGTISLGL
jgi:hypothetical protein